jgi:SAM-dependent methyltransferase
MPPESPDAVTDVAARPDRDAPAAQRHARASVFQQEAERRLQAFLDRTFELRPHDVVLDVGCGRVLPIDVPLDVRLVGLDNDVDALGRNANIDDAIVGDIQDVQLPAAAFDLVLCWNVLEHLERLDRPLATMARAIRPGGALVVGIPNRRSLKGLVTRATPHGFHVWAYRRLFGWTNAGTPGHGPYRTYFARALSARGLAALAAPLGLELVYRDSHGRIPPLPRSMRIAWRALAAAGRIVTLGRWHPLQSDLILVFRRRTAERA